MNKLFTTYRVLAFAVGIFLASATITFLLDKLLTEGSALQRFGENMQWLWIFHGWLFIVYVVVAFLLSRRANWSFVFLALMLIAGLIPGLIFWVEHHVAQKLRAEHPELLATTS